MLKKLCTAFSLLILLCAMALISIQPIFNGYSDSFEVYLKSASSLAEIKSVSKTEYYGLRTIKGESVELEAQGFELNKLLNDFDAQIKFSESTSDSQIYYAYSPKLKRIKTVKGQKINLHVVIASERVVLGSPLIFGSF